MNASTATALTIVDQVEQSPAILALDARAQALVDLLPDAAAAARFRRVVIQALVRNPDLLDCTPESVVLSVFEAASMGLEPTGAAGGAHLVPYNVKVAKNPDRWERRAQLIPDYRGVIRMITKPPSDVLSVQADVVKEGDQFAYQLGTDPWIEHVPDLTNPQRSAKPTTHVYAVFRLRSGPPVIAVEDRAGIEAVRKRGRGDGFSPWSTDWDEMGKKTMIKRGAKLCPVRPEIRSILVREDELAGDVDPDPAAIAAGPTASPSRVSRLGARLARDVTPAADPPAAEDPPADDVDDPVWARAAATADATPSLLERLRTNAEASGLNGPMTDAQRNALAPLLAPLKGHVGSGVAVAFGPDAKEAPTAAQANAIAGVASQYESADAFVSDWRAMIDAAASQVQA